MEELISTRAATAREFAWEEWKDSYSFTKALENYSFTLNGQRILQSLADPACLELAMQLVYAHSGGDSIAITDKNRAAAERLLQEGIARHRKHSRKELKPYCPLITSLVRREYLKLIVPVRVPANTPVVDIIRAALPIMDQGALTDRAIYQSRNTAGGSSRAPQESTFRQHLVSALEKILPRDWRLQLEPKTKTDSSLGRKPDVVVTINGERVKFVFELGVNMNLNSTTDGNRTSLYHHVRKAIECVHHCVLRDVLLTLRLLGTTKHSAQARRGS